MSSGEATIWSEKLSAISYGNRGRDLVRFQIDPNDDLVAAIVRGAVSSGDCHEKHFREHFSIENVDTLLTFASRRVVQLRRSSSAGLIDEVLNVYGLFLWERDVPWDKWFKGVLLIARSIGVDLDELYRQFDDLVPLEISERASIAFGAMDRVETFAQCSLAETSTTYGVGLLELMVFHSVRMRMSSGILADRRIEFDPTTNIAQIAVTLADSYDATGHVATGPLCQDQLAAQMFDMVVPGSYVANRGCISFLAEGVNASRTFNVFVAEMDDDTDIESLAAAATEQGDQAVVFDARRLVLISAQPSFEEITEANGEEEDPDVDDVDFYNFESLAQVALNESLSTVKSPSTPVAESTEPIEDEQIQTDPPEPPTETKPLTFGGFS